MKLEPQCTCSITKNPKYGSYTVLKNYKITSLFESRSNSKSATKPTMSTTKSTPAIKQEANSAAIVSPDNNTPINESPMLLTIDKDTAITKIHEVPVSDTWKTYIFNNSSPTLTEHEWKEMSDDDKYAELVNLRSIPSTISSPFTTFVITPDTDIKVINRIPKKDCRILLKAYADSQGFPDYDSTIETMLVDPMRQELIKARNKLISRPQYDNKTGTKKTKHFGLPFVLTHATSDADINSADATSIQNELKNIYADRNLHESVEWDSLQDNYIRDMAIIERNEMLKCFTPKPENIKQSNPIDNNEYDPNGNPFVYIIDDDATSTENTDSDDDNDDVSMEDLDNSHSNESDELIEQQLETFKKEKKTFTFEFSKDTTDQDIYLLSHRRAIRIAIKHANNNDDPLSESFINEATTEEVHHYLIDERNEICSQYDYEKFNFNATTTDADIKRLHRNQLEDFIA